MQNYRSVYEQWLSDSVFDPQTKEELRAISDNPREIEDRFYKELEFGTAGLRGILGAGINRMNLYTVGKVTQGLCAFLLENDPTAKESGVVIAYDPRHMSRKFARECAAIIAANGIKAYLFDDIRPTPELSFSVRQLSCASGIVITASHNPSDYNGYKVYGRDGAQMSVEDSDKVVQYTSKINGYGEIKKTDFDVAVAAGQIVIVGSDIDDVYLKRVHTLSLRLDDIKQAVKEIKIIYTPLHGTGNKLVRRVLAENGYENVLVVDEQVVPDPNFSTVESPNPENRSAFNMAIELAKKENVDIIFGTDPDCDRIGVVFRDFNGEYIVLNGNQIGCLLLEYVLKARQDLGLQKDNDFVIKSIVTTKLANMIAESFGVEMREVFTGFKFICKLVNDLDEFGDKNFVFGFEESNGYLAGNFVRDKDAVIAAMLVAEMAAWHRFRNETLADALKQIYEKYGYTIDEVISYTLKGKEGLDKIAAAMNELRTTRPESFGTFDVSLVRDFETEEILETGKGVVGKTDMGEQSNVIYFQMSDGSCYVIRPSGTEPKIKLYFGVTGTTKDEAEALMKKFKANVTEVIEKHLGI